MTDDERDSWWVELWASIAEAVHTGWHTTWVWLWAVLRNERCVVQGCRRYATVRYILGFETQVETLDVCSRHGFFEMRGTIHLKDGSSITL